MFSSIFTEFKVIFKIWMYLLMSQSHFAIFNLSKSHWRFLENAFKYPAVLFYQTHIKVHECIWSSGEGGIFLGNLLIWVHRIFEIDIDSFAKYSMTINDEASKARIPGLCMLSILIRDFRQIPPNCCVNLSFLIHFWLIIDISRLFPLKISETQ